MEDVPPAVAGTTPDRAVWTGGTSAEMTLEYQLTPREIRAALRTMSKRDRRLVRTLSIFAAFLVVLGVLAAITGGRDRSTVAVFGELAVVFVAFVALLFVVVPWISGRRDSPMGRRIALHVVPRGLVFDSAYIRTCVGWPAIVQVGETRLAYLCHIAARRAIVIPRSAFDSRRDEQRFRELVSEHTATELGPLAGTSAPSD